ncbi:hypothetical protein AGMMS49940_18170 [Spirochaetia bacterium]|nr:hypothetical protein AGMMS49940_18170 [Spirochaetia bacterium]
MLYDLLSNTHVLQNIIHEYCTIVKYDFCLIDSIYGFKAAFYGEYEAIQKRGGLISGGAGRTL